jgi:hypothetical protein
MMNGYALIVRRGRGGVVVCVAMMQVLVDFPQAIEQALPQIDMLIQHQLAADARLETRRA